MPLNRPAQALTPGPRGVSDARRWATQVLTEIGRPELVESACISVSEVIMNVGRTPNSGERLLARDEARPDRGL